MREVAGGETQGSRWNSGGHRLVLKAHCIYYIKVLSAMIKVCI